jgi:hypothetical protein
VTPRRGPDFNDLVGDDLPAEERARLQRAHDLLVEAGAPPELTPALEEPPASGASVAWLPRRRLGTALVLAAALVVASFATGYLVGDRSDDSQLTAGFKPDRTVVLGEAGGPVAVVRVGKADEDGNHPMLVTLEGLEHKPQGDYYSLLMTRDGMPVATCGTFNAAGEGRTNVRLSTPYSFEGYDGLLLTEYRRADHQERPLLRASL